MFREDIVVVTVEYRSGILGFLSDGTKYMPGGWNSILIVITSSCWFELSEAAVWSTK